MSLPAHHWKLLDPSGLAGALILAVGFIILGLCLSWLVRRVLKSALRHDKSDRIDEITLSFLSRLAILAIWLLIAVAYTQVVPALDKLASALLAGAGLASVIIGFAAQTTLGNLISGVSLVLYKPFRRGDRLQVTAPTPDQCETGTVVDISLGFTTLQTDDGRTIVVANSTMSQQTFLKLHAEPAGAAPAASHAPDSTSPGSKG